MHLCNLESTQNTQGHSLDPSTALCGYNCLGGFITKAMKEPGKHQVLALGAMCPVERQSDKARLLPPHLASQVWNYSWLGANPERGGQAFSIAVPRTLLLRFQLLWVILPSPQALTISVQPQGSQEGIASFPVEAHGSKRPHSHHPIHH